MFTFFREGGFYYLFVPLAILALIAGFTISSRSRTFNRVSGQVLKGLLVLILLGLTVAAVIRHGWPAGITSFIMMFVSGAIGSSIYASTNRRLYRKYRS